MAEETKKILAIITFEMMGRPPEHLVSTMNQLVEVLGQEKGLKVVKSKVHEAKKIDNRDKDGVLITKGELFSTFAEVEVEVDDIMMLLAVEFKYLPSHVEVIEPEQFRLSNLELGSIMSEIAARLHHYDSIAKSALMNNQMLTNRMKQILEKHPEIVKEMEEEMRAHNQVKEDAEEKVEEKSSPKVKEDKKKKTKKK
jgi:hypothetical protein